MKQRRYLADHKWHKGKQYKNVINAFLSASFLPDGKVSEDQGQRPHIKQYEVQKIQPGAPEHTCHKQQ